MSIRVTVGLSASFFKMVYMEYPSLLLRLQGMLSVAAFFHGSGSFRQKWTKRFSGNPVL